MKLVNLGLINPDGSPRGAAAPAPAAPTASGVWSPESVSAATSAAGTEQKSKLWLPGMD
jgi:hypothetical protein